MQEIDAPETAPAPYMLFFRNTGAENYAQLTPDERQQLVAKWNAWYENLLAQGKALAGQPLETETRIVAGPGGARITDGPFPETKEAIGGYVTVQVDSLEEATEISQQHPALHYGMIIEIRQLTHDCHLGVSAHHQRERIKAIAT